jgi:hypothetical protein
MEGATDLRAMVTGHREAERCVVFVREEELPLGGDLDEVGTPDLPVQLDLERSRIRARYSVRKKKESTTKRVRETAPNGEGNGRRTRLSWGPSARIALR